MLGGHRWLSFLVISVFRCSIFFCYEDVEMQTPSGFCKEILKETEETDLYKII